MLSSAVHASLLFSAETESHKHHGPLKPNTNSIIKSLQRFIDLILSLVNCIWDSPEVAFANYMIYGVIYGGREVQ